MYLAKSRASWPFVIAFPAMLAVGRTTLDGSPAFFASAAIAGPVMSGVPTICSAPSLAAETDVRVDLLVPACVTALPAPSGRALNHRAELSQSESVDSRN